VIRNHARAAQARSGSVDSLDVRRHLQDVPTRDQITAGTEVARELRERYRVTGVLLSAARAGYIAALRCDMPHCFAASRDRFEPLAIPLGPWMPTHEHFPVARRFKGRRDVTNAVLAHRRCNNVGYKIEELEHHLKSLRLEDGSALRPEAIQTAIDDHVEQRRTAAGRYPRSRGSRRRAITIARQTHESLGRTD
jgi:hypothetical protein